MWRGGGLRGITDIWTDGQTKLVQEELSLLKMSNTIGLVGDLDLNSCVLLHLSLTLSRKGL